MGCSTVTDVSVEASAPIRTDIMTSPINVHMIPKIRAGIERGDRSPYLYTNKAISLKQAERSNSLGTLCIRRSIFQSDINCRFILHVYSWTKKKTGVLCGKIFKTYLKHSFEIFYISLHQHSLKIGVILKSKSRLNDCAMIYSPNSCHGDKRPPESFSNTFNKIGWKFFRVILWFLMNRKWNMANAVICHRLQLKIIHQYFGRRAHLSLH